MKREFRRGEKEKSLTEEILGNYGNEVLKMNDSIDISDSYLLIFCLAFCKKDFWGFLKGEVGKKKMRWWFYFSFYFFNFFFF